MIPRGLRRIALSAALALGALGGGTAAAQTCAALNIATGGTVTQITQNNQVFCVHRFDGSGSFALNQPRNVDYLIVGGGGGAGTGGGGAGGMLEGTIARTAANYTVTVGAGGAATTGFNFSGTTGGNSSVFGIVANGGGGGGRAGAGGNGLAGGSGGGAARDSNPANSRVGGTGISGQGFAGADNVAGATDAGGGGGGAGGPGNGINGGPGRASVITGASVIYAGGGASARNGGDGAPGDGASNPGGGGTYVGSTNVFNPGRAGVVILRYVANAPPAANAGPDVTVTEGATVTLNGLGSTDPENNIQSYAWTQVTGTNVTLSNPNTAQASFVAGAPVGSSETLTFRLTVTDAFGLTSTDDISVTVQAASNPPPPAAGGGNSVFDYLDPATQRTFRVHVFEQNGTFTLDRTRDIDYLIVGGGGGGGAIAGGGGGAGGLRQGTQTNQAAGSYPVIVGLGGAGDNRTSTPDAPVDGGGNGNPSSVFGVEAAGGGGGGTFNFDSFNGAGRNGGSGGGASHQGPPGQPNPSGQGSVGGTGTINTGDSSGGGGGGAGRAGGDGTAVQAGRGGDGVSSDITGSPVFYAGGGAGGGDTRGDTVLANVGGLGGGGASTNTAQIAGSGAPGTGGGGAGGWVIDSVVPSTGGNGGSGVVILRYVVNTPPTADAGPDADAFAGLEFTLNGTGSTDAENNITSYQWVQTGGTTQTLTGATTAQASFTPGQPASGTSETLTFRLTVTDAFGAQSTDEVVITLQGMAELTATKTALVFSEDGSGCADFNATPPSEPVNPAAIPGACIEYLVTVVNDGPVPATAIDLADSLPPQLTLVAATRAGWDESAAGFAFVTSAPVVRVENGIIGTGANNTATITIRATVN
jgi:uncharacterized repeat protein (TIGR01451 family)